MNPESAYECASCGEIFADIEDAANCHNTSYHYVFFCGECWGNWNTKQEAERCCQEGEDDSL